MIRRSRWLFFLLLVLGFALRPSEPLVAGQDRTGQARPDQNEAASARPGQSDGKRDSNPSNASPGERATADPPAGGNSTSEAITDSAGTDAKRSGPMPLPDDLPEPARFVTVRLHDEVSLGMASFVERVAEELGAGDILVLDINTFGGRVDAAVIIRDALLELRVRKAMAVAYVHPRAISAGALISLAADIIVVAPGATMGAATPVRVGEGGQMQPVEEKTVSYMRKEMRATAEARGRSGDIAEAMVDADIEVPGLSAKGKLLTLDGKQALEWGVASVEAATLGDVLAGLGYGDGQRAHTVREVQWSWAEEVAAFLTSSTLSGLLMSIGMLGLLIGLYTGGSALPLTLGGVCLGLFFFGHHVVNLAGFEEMMLFVLGAGLLLVEVFAPGHIVPGVAGVVLILASLVMGLLSFDSVPFSVQWQEGWVVRALGTVFGSVAAAAVLGIAAFQLLPSTRLGRALLLDAAIQSRASDRAMTRNLSVVGDIGVAESDLRPAGKVKVDGRRYDAVAEIGYIPSGAEVRVRTVRGFSLVVAPVANSGSGTTTATEESS
ncbi:MAG: nodulation protein NfeD [Proteobacteria bacterium]|nr:nodulation protein NfeD [Pseudomonadota bacterium]